MDKHEKLDEALEKMREANAASGEATPPDWAKLEQNVILRLVKRVRSSRLVIGLLSTIIIGTIVVWLAWRLFVPILDFGWHAAPPPERWQVGSIEVSIQTPRELPQIAPNTGYYLYHPTTTTTSNDLSVGLVELPKPVMGLRYLGTVYYDKTYCIFLPTSTQPANRLKGNSVYDFASEQIMAKSIEYYAKDMLASKIWPVRLWRLYPTVKLLSEGKYQVIEEEPIVQTFSMTKLYYGRGYVYSFRAYSRGTDSATGLLASIWPERYVLSVESSKLVVDGTESGYQIYEDSNFWGSNTKENLTGMRKALKLVDQAANLSQDEIPADFKARLARVNEVVNAKAPEYSKISDKTALRKMLSPWDYWDEWSEELDRKKHELYGFKEDLVVAQGNVGTVAFSKPEKPIPPFTPGSSRPVESTYGRPSKATFQLSRGNIALAFRSTFAGVGPVINVLVDGTPTLEFKVRSQKPYPVLETKFDAKTEKLLADAASIAREVLTKPSSTWPETTVPLSYLEGWINDIAARRIVLRAEKYDAELHSYIRWGGDRSELLLALGPEKRSDLELIIKPDGFSIYVRSSESILNSKTGVLDAVQAEGNKNPILTATELRQLKGCLALLAAFPREKSKLPPGLEITGSMPMLKNGMPTKLMPGIKALATFLEKPELPEAKRVAQPPKLEWGMDTYEAIREALQ